MKAKFQTQSNLDTQCCSHNPLKIHQTRKQTPVYGKPTKLRCQQPSMFQILTWKDPNYHQETQNQKVSNQNARCHFEQDRMQSKADLKKEHHLYQRMNRVQNNSKNMKFHTSNGIDQNSQQFSFRNGVKVSEPISKNKLKKQVQSLKRLDVKNNLTNLQNDYQKQKNQKEIKTRKNLNDELTKTKASSKKLIKTPLSISTKENLKARYLSPKAEIRPNLDEETIQHLRKDALKKFKQTTRDLSNSAYLTYFNKPPFQTYGRGNTHNPGVLYGDYMYSHNIIPHTGDNKPKNQQTYQTALIKAKSAGNLHPRPPLTKFQYGSSMSYHAIGQIYPSSSNIKSFQIDKIDIQKLPKFTVNKQDEQNKRNYYIRQNMVSKPQFLTNQQVQEKLWKSNKDDIDGKQITYSKKIERTRKESFQY